MQSTLNFKITDEKKIFLELLHNNFNSRRLELLSARQIRAKKFLQGENLSTLEETKNIRESQWQVAAAPADLIKRNVEITGPAEAKMIINALNSGADVFMADLEDALSPTWQKVLEGQEALSAAVRKTLSLVGENGKSYQLNNKIATLLVRPRGLHLSEKNYTIKDEPISGSLFDFGLYFFNNAKELLKNGSGPYFYIPKLESHLEARWWNDVFKFSQDYLGIPQGTIRATVLIETAPAAFEMEEILFELKEHMSGLNAGRWDYIFSFIKKFNSREDYIFPDRHQVTMTVPFLQAYCEKIVEVCHKRGAHAIGGMAAFIPNRKEPAVTEAAFEKVKADKAREAHLGFDGSWVAHPDLVPLARAEFDQVLAGRPHQKDKRLNRLPSDEALRNVHIPNSSITEAGVRNNIFVALVYTDYWLRGTGAVGILNLMEDAATAEISRSQLWQWIHHSVTMAGGQKMTADIYRTWAQEELKKATEQGLIQDPQRVLSLISELVLNPEFAEFLTVKCYSNL